MIITIAFLAVALAFPKYQQSLFTSKPETLKKLAYQLQIASDLQVDVDQDQVCNWLKDYPRSTAQDIYHTQLATSFLEECQIDQDWEVQAFDKDDFESLYYNSLISKECPKLQEYLTAGGAAKPNLKKQEDSYKTAAQLYHLASICNDESVFLSIQEAIFNFQEIYEGVIAIIDRDNSAAITAQILYSFFTLNITKLHPQIEQLITTQVYQQTILNFLYQRTNVVGTVDEQYWITKLFVLEQVKSFVYPVFQDYYVNKGVSLIHVKFINLQGEKVKLSSVNATLGDEVLIYSQVKSKEFSGYFETNETGVLNIRIQFENYTLTYPVKVLKEVEIEEVMFDVVDSKTEKPNFQHSVEADEMYPVILNASEKSYLHIILKISPKVKSQVAIRLVHPQFPAATTQVIAERDNKRKIYYGIIDFGDPEHVIPLNAIYKVEILIADVNIVPKRWSFLQIDTKFQAQTTFQNDSYYKLQPEIVHQFSKDQPEVPLLFVSFFVIVIIVAFVFFLKMLSNLEINFDKLPEGTSLYLVYLFLGLIIALFLILTLFWIKLNLIETVTLLGILSVPLVIVGNYALLSLRIKEKTD